MVSPVCTSKSLMQTTLTEAGQDVFGIDTSASGEVKAGKKKTKTTFMATMEVLNFTFGVMTMMSLPVLFSQAGVAAVFFFFFFAVSIVIATGWILGLVLEHATQFVDNPDFASVSLMTFGHREAAIITTMAGIDCALYVVALFIMMGVNIPNFLPVSNKWALQFSASCATVVHVMPGKLFRKVAAWSSCTTILACLLVLVTGLQLTDAAFEAPEINVGSWISAFGVPFYGCAFHVYYPAIFNSVPSRSVYNQAIVLGNLAFLLIGGVFGYGTYCLFGTSTKTQATDNIGRDTHGHVMPYLGWAGAFVGLLIFVKNLFVLKPAAQPILDMALSPVLSKVPRMDQSKQKMAYWIVATVVYFGLARAAEKFAEYIILFEQAVSMTLYSALAIIFPLMCYMRLMETDFVMYNLCIIGVVLGYMLIIIGTVSCVVDF